MLGWGFLDEISIDSIDWIKKFSIINVGGHHPIGWGHDWNKMVKEGWIPSLFLSWDVYFLLPYGIGILILSPSDSRTEKPHGAPGFQAFDLRLRATPSAPLLLRPLDLNWIVSPTYLVLQLTNSRSWVFSASATSWARTLYIRLVQK